MKTGDVTKRLLAARQGTSDSSDTDDQQHWTDPIPLPGGLPTVKCFDTALLPSSLQDWITDIAERTQCPIDYPAVASMVALAGVVGRRIGIRPKQQDDWLVVPNLWGAIIGRPGVMKSPSIREVLKPLKRLEVEAKEAFTRAVQTREAEKIVREEQAKASRTRIRKALTDGGDALAIASEMIEGERPEPMRRRYVVNEPTTEKLGVILNENPNGVLLYRDELLGFLRSLDRDGRECDRAFYLEAWAGLGRFTYDRIGRGTLDIESICVSILGAIGPAPLQEYVRAAARQGRDDDGFIQRFQLMTWPDISSDWRNIDRWPDTEARDRAFATFVQLDALDPVALGAKCDGFDVEGVPYLRFDEEAQTVFDAWRYELERVVRSGDEHPAMEAHLSKYRSLVPSLALLLFLADGGRGEVSLAAVEKAIRWAEYLESHARRVYAAAVEAEVCAARELAKRILKGDLSDGFTLRDVYRKHWSGLSSRDDVRAAVGVLEDHNWIVCVREDTGGSPLNRYRINPHTPEIAGIGSARSAKSRS